jgi:hypothetical protein
VDLLFCLLYALITLVWLVNFCFHPSFFIPLQLGFMVSAATKSILMGLTAIQWEAQRVCSVPSESARHFFMIVHYTLFISLLLLAFSGWGTYRERLSKLELWEPVLSSAILIGGVTFGSQAFSLNQIFASVALALTGFFLLLHCSVSTLFLLKAILSVYQDTETEPPPSVRLIAKFGVSLLVAVSGIIVCFFAMLPIDISEFLAWLVLEDGMLAVTCIELAVFLLRDPEGGELANPIAGTRDVRLLESPDASALVILSTSDK